MSTVHNNFQVHSDPNVWTVTLNKATCALIGAAASAARAMVKFFKELLKGIANFMKLGDCLGKLGDISGWGDLDEAIDWIGSCLGGPFGEGFKWFYKCLRKAGHYGTEIAKKAGSKGIKFHFNVGRTAAEMNPVPIFGAVLSAAQEIGTRAVTGKGAANMIDDYRAIN